MPNPIKLDRKLDMSTPVNKMGNQSSNFKAIEGSGKFVVGQSNFKSQMGQGGSRNGAFPPQMNSSKINLHD